MTAVVSSVLNTRNKTQPIRDVANGFDADIRYVRFEGMRNAIVMTAGGAGHGDSMVDISHCTFADLDSAMTSYADTRIPDEANALCDAAWNSNHTSTTSTTSTASPWSSATSTRTIDTTQLQVTNMSAATSTTTTSETRIVSPSSSATMDDGGDECSGSATMRRMCC